MYLCGGLFFPLYSALFDLIVAFGKRILSAVCPGPHAIPTDFWRPAQERRGRPSQPSLFQHSSLLPLCDVFILSAFLLVSSQKTTALRRNEFLTKCIKFGWGVGPCCPSDGSLSWNFWISCNPPTKASSPYRKLFSFCCTIIQSIQLLQCCHKITLFRFPFWDPCATLHVPVEVTLQGRWCLDFGLLCGK